MASKAWILSNGLWAIFGDVNLAFSIQFDGLKTFRIYKCLFCIENRIVCGSDADEWMKVPLVTTGNTIDVTVIQHISTNIGCVQDAVVTEVFVYILYKLRKRDIGQNVSDVLLSPSNLLVRINICFIIDMYEGMSLNYVEINWHCQTKTFVCARTIYEVIKFNNILHCFLFYQTTTLPRCKLYFWILKVFSLWW